MVWKLGWVTVCDVNWNDELAKAVCLNMGYVDGRALCCSKLTFLTSKPESKYSNKFQRFNGSCPANTTNLQNCPGYITTTVCDSHKIASVICYNTDKATVNNSFAIRFVNSSKNYGLLEVRRYGQWGLINGNKDAGWTHDVADLACRSVGYPGGIAYYKKSNGNPLKTFWITELNCTGSETSLDECVTEWGAPVSKDIKAAEAICYRTEKPTITLVNGTSSYGLVQISVDGVQGSICSSSSNPDNTAEIICRQLGYEHGIAVETGYFGKGTRKIYLKAEQCLDNSFWDCENNYEWGDVEDGSCLDHSKDLAVYCHSNVRILQGDYSAGVVSVFWDNKWYLLCSNAINQTEATVICKELQYDDGYILQPGSFGSVITGSGSPQSSYHSSSYHCLGNETSLTSCTNDPINCTSDYTDYSAIKCYNGSLNTDQSLKLVRSPYANVGVISITKNGFTGSVCFDNFTSNNAQVVCRDLGYSGGYSTRYSARNTVFAYQELNCAGNEHSVFDCPTGTGRCRPQYNKPSSASVFCYNNTAPILRFEKGGSSGFLELVVGDEVGAVCVKQYGYTKPLTICKQMGYRSGKYNIYRRDERRTLPVFLNGLRCTDDDDNIFECRGDYWRQHNTTRCYYGSLAVECFNNVRLLPEPTTGIGLLGYIEFHKAYRSQKWTPVCSGIGDNAAKVICRELNAPYYQILADNVYLNRDYSFHGIQNINCIGTESTVFDCTYLTSECESSASLLCSKTPIQPAIIMDSSSNNGGYSAQVSLSNARFTGPMCIEGWTDMAAMVLCKQEHYLTGYKMLLAHNTDPITVGKDIVCNGNESSLNECHFTVGKKCAISNGGSNYGGGAVCSNSTQGFEIRLKPDNYSRNWGLVEVAFEGVWGTVQSNWQYSTARMVCQQLGFVGGDPAHDLTYTSNGGPTWLSGITNCGVEKEIWECQLGDFNVTASHSPLLVKCVQSVSLSTAGNIGHVIWNLNKAKNMICADGFSKEEATVVCRQLGYLYGYKLNQEYSPSPYANNTYFNLQCTGLETRIEDCKYDQELCVSNTTAEVICSNDGDHTDYEASFDYRYYKNNVVLTHMGVHGFICADNWTDASATVVCKEVHGKTGGIAYRYYDPYILNKYPELRFKWKSNVQCIGNETHLSQCPYTSWQHTNCSSQHVAAVYCYSTPGFDIRLVGGHNGSGRVEALIDGYWGMVCGSSFYGEEASVVCRMLNYTNGNSLPYGTYGQGNGQQLMIYRPSCTGNEMSILECPMQLKPPSYYCKNWMQAVIHCTGNDKTDVRLSSTSTSSSSGKYGMLEIFKDDDWYPVCDADFTDDLARLACRELDYQDGVYRCCSPLGTVKKTFVTVNGCDHNSTTSITSCAYNKGCSSGQYVTIYCTHKILDSDMESNSISLRNGVEIKLGGDKMSVCKTNWTDVEANVLCKSQGYDGGIAHYAKTSYFFAEVMFGNFDCNGTEVNIDQCHIADIHNTGCSKSNQYEQQIAGVKCYSKGQAPYVSLNSTDVTDEKIGYPLVIIDGITHNICSGGWDNTDAQVFCRQLGYIFGESKLYDSQASENAKMFYPNCNGDEKSLFLCAYFLTTTKCRPASAKCYNEAPVVRLSPSYLEHYGMLEIYKDDDWYPVCDADFTDDLARLACRELDYQDGVYRCCSPLGHDNRTFVTITACDANKSASITACTSTKGCSSGHYVTVYCSNMVLKDDMVVSVKHSRLKTTLDGEPVSVCKSNWTNTEANVTCKSLGYDGGIALYDVNHYGLLVMFGNFNCIGTETNLIQCSKNIHNTGCSEPFGFYNQLIAGVKCYRNGQVPYVSMDSSDYEGENEGNALVTIDGATHNICGYTWGNSSATVFCRELGFTNGSAIVLSEKVNNTQLLDRGCKGDEISLFMCGFNYYFMPCPPAAARCYTEEIQITTSNVVIPTTFADLVTTTTDGELGDADQKSGLNDKDVTIIASSAIGGVVLCLGVLVAVLIKKFVFKSVVSTITSAAPVENARR